MAKKEKWRPNRIEPKNLRCDQLKSIKHGAHDDDDDDDDNNDEDAKIRPSRKKKKGRMKKKIKKKLISYTAKEAEIYIKKI